MKRQREHYRSGKLLPEKFTLLEDIGFKWKCKAAHYTPPKPVAYSFKHKQIVWITQGKSQHQARVLAIKNGNYLEVQWTSNDATDLVKAEDVVAELPPRRSSSNKKRKRVDEEWATKRKTQVSGLGPRRGSGKNCKQN